MYACKKEKFNQSFCVAVMRDTKEMVSMMVSAERTKRMGRSEKIRLKIRCVNSSDATSRLKINKYVGMIAA